MTSVRCDSCEDISIVLGDSERDTALRLKSIGWYMEDLHLCPSCHIEIFDMKEDK